MMRLAFRNFLLLLFTILLRKIINIVVVAVVAVVSVVEVIVVVVP